MSILRILVGLLAVFIAFPAFANDVQVGRGVICDTKEQAERYVALFKDYAVEALTRVNAEAKTEHACGVAAIAYLPGQVGTPTRNEKGEAFRVLRILVLGVVTNLGVQQVTPFPQFTILKVEEIAV